MLFSRRGLLAVSASLINPLPDVAGAPIGTPNFSGARRAALQPQRSTPVMLTPAGTGRIAFRVQGIDDAILLPDGNTRIAQLLPIAGRDLAAIAFAADLPTGRMELVALAGWDADGLRLKGLELLSWTGADGTILSSRLAGIGDRQGLRISRDAESPSPGRPRHWEFWADQLAWRDRGPLAIKPIHTPVPGTWQDRLHMSRLAVLEMLEAPCRAVPDEAAPMLAASLVLT